MLNKIESFGVVDLFSGPGGLSLGFKRAGFKIIAGVESDPFASKTYSNNFGEVATFFSDISHIETDKLLDLAANKSVENLVIVGGPPCQPYSKANKQNNGHNHPYASSLSHFNRIVKETKPAAFLFENVTAFSVLNGWYEFLEDFKDAGYLVSFSKIKLSDFGLPQNRKRLFVAGFHSGYDFDISKMQCMSNPVKVEDAIADLPKLPSYGGGDPEIKHPQKASSLYAKKITGDSKRLYNHWCTRHSEEVVETIKHIKEGKSLLQMWKNLPKSIKMRFNNAKSIHSNIYRRLSWDTLSPTIVHARRAMLIHPKEHRIISVREAARLQSFPDSFRFFGGTNEEYQQVANAVPPVMAEFLAKKFRKVLLKNGRDQI